MFSKVKDTEKILETTLEVMKDRYQSLPSRYYEGTSQTHLPNIRKENFLIGYCREPKGVCWDPSCNPKMTRAVLNLLSSVARFKVVADLGNRLLTNILWG